jgi:hypothetical protein
MYPFRDRSLNCCTFVRLTVIVVGLISNTNGGTFIRTESCQAMSTAV